MKFFWKWKYCNDLTNLSVAFLSRSVCPFMNPFTVENIQQMCVTSVLILGNCPLITLHVFSISKNGSGNEKELHFIGMDEVLLEVTYLFYYLVSAWMEHVSHGLRNVRRAYSKISDQFPNANSSWELTITMVGLCVLETETPGILLTRCICLSCQSQCVMVRRTAYPNLT